MTEKTKIIEKVKFWEEQDKINQALIPRILDMHEQIKSTSLLTQQNSSNYLQSKSLITNLELNAQKEYDKSTLQINRLESDLSQLLDKSNFEVSQQNTKNIKIVQLIKETRQDIEKRHEVLALNINNLKNIFDNQNKKNMHELQRQLQKQENYIQELLEDFTILAEDFDQFDEIGNRKPHIFNIITFLIATIALIISIYLVTII